MTRLLVEPMAKKSTKAPASAAPSARKPMVVQVRGSEEYKAWVEDVAKQEGFTVSTLFDQALRKFAEGKYGKPPER